MNFPVTAHTSQSLAMELQSGPVSQLFDAASKKNKPARFTGCSEFLGDSPKTLLTEAVYQIISIKNKHRKPNWGVKTLNDTLSLGKLEFSLSSKMLDLTSTQLNMNHSCLIKDDILSILLSQLCCFDVLVRELSL